MVKKRTRWLSAIAAVIMLVSMFAGIIVPAGAASGSEFLNALQKKYEALEQEHFVEVRGDTVAEVRAKIAEQIAVYEATDLEHERAICETIGSQIDQGFIETNKGNLVSELTIRYSLKEFYEELGYDPDASTYYISDAEDWNAAAASGSLFIGKTLLVTNNIDFKGVKADPLTVNEIPFQGVLDGQGYRFINMTINIGDTAAEKSYKYGGLVAALTGGTIKNLGLDGGSLVFAGEDTVTDRNEGVGSFAGYIGTGGLLQNCWSTMTVTNNTKTNSKGQTTLDGAKNGVSGLIGWGEGGAIDNCFFAGTVNNTGSKRAATDLVGYTTNAVKVYNSIGAGTLNCDATYNPAAICIHYNAYTDIENLGVYNSYAVGKNAIRHRANYNPYNYDGTNYVTIPDTDVTFTKDIVHKYTPEATNAAYMLNSPEEAAWAVNRRFDTTHQSATREYIISVDENGKLYMAKNEGVYRKVTIEGSASGVYYFKEGAKINLLEDLGLMVADSITIDRQEFASALSGYDLTVPAGDIVITVTYTLDGEIQLYTTELTKRVAKYEKLDFSLFDCAQLLEDWVKQAKAELAKSEKDLAMIQTLLEMESGEDGFLNNMALLPGKYPTASDYEEAYESYLEFNRSKEWAITSPEDWLALIRLSETNNFTGDTFHILNDIDFKKQPMLPVSFGDNGEVDDAAYRFNGTIEGHNHAFKNINVRVTLDTSSTNSHIVVGMIGKLGNKARINDFGVDSGSITVDGSVYSSRTLYVATFGEALHQENGSSMVTNYVNDHAELNNVWSGATITADATTGTNMAAGLMAHSQYSSVSINGGYFFGTLSPESNSYGITTSVRETSFFNVLSDSATAAEMFSSYNKLYGANNVYTTGSTIIDATTYPIANYGNVASALEGAWIINGKQPAAEGVNTVYFTMKDGKVAFGAGDGSDQIRKITFMNSGAVIGEMYGAAGTTVQLVCEKAESFESILVGDSSALNGDLLELGNEDVTIEVKVDNSEAIKTQIAVLRELMAKYDGLNLDEFANGAEITTWKTAAQKAIDDEDLAALNSAINAEAALAENLELKDGFWPTFTQYEKYKDFNKNNDWLIDSKADWDAMNAYALAAEKGNYFEGFTFHLKRNVDLGSSTTYFPLGAKDDRLFAGTIDGHGYGFENVNIKVVSGDVPKGGTYYNGGSMNGSVGLIAFLGPCVIRDFGVNSGTINAGTANASGNVSTFGTVPANTAATAPTFIRVWSGADLVAAQGGHVNALVGLLASESASVKVNGFIFNGTMKKAKKYNSARDTAYGVYGGNSAAPSDDGEFYNIMAAPTINTSAITASFLFGFTSEDAFKAAVEKGKVKNVYGYGNIAETYRNGTSGQTAGKTTFDGVSYEMILKGSVEEAAWTSNNNQVAGQEPVYFTLRDDEVWYGTAENQIRRVLVMADGEVTNTHYVLPGEKVALNATTDYRITEGTLSSLEGNVLTVGNENVVVTAATCEHPEDACEYTPIAGTNTHTILCKDCGKDFTGTCELGAWAANDDLVIADGVVTAGTHSASCTKCGGVQTENCVGTLVPNAVDCTEDGTMTFDCCDRADAVAIGSRRAEHTYSGNWTEEGAPEGKEINPCEYCDAYLVRSAGKVNVSTGNLVKAGEEVDVVITLPYALTEATIAITPAAESKYTIESVTPENLFWGDDIQWPDGGFAATIKDVQAGATVTVTVKVEKFGFVEDGFLDVSVTNAKNEEGDVIDAFATAQITLARVRGDADVNGVVTVMDALAVLQYSVGQSVQIHIANADMNNDGYVTAADAPMIIREWMLTV
ncbi:MAG: dockerin type I repeat-containing protein [Clostridia bacterium]|nr:dockerin type I repeat-containing protein [Clostridia bacterium]